MAPAAVLWAIAAALTMSLVSIAYLMTLVGLVAHPESGTMGRPNAFALLAACAAVYKNLLHGPFLLTFMTSYWRSGSKGGYYMCQVSALLVTLDGIAFAVNTLLDATFSGCGLRIQHLLQMALAVVFTLAFFGLLVSTTCYTDHDVRSIFTCVARNGSSPPVFRVLELLIFSQVVLRVAYKIARVANRSLGGDEARTFDTFTPGFSSTCSGAGAWAHSFSAISGFLESYTLSFHYALLIAVGYTVVATRGVQSRGLLIYGSFVFACVSVLTSALNPKTPLDTADSALSSALYPSIGICAWVAGTSLAHGDTRERGSGEEGVHLVNINRGLRADSVEPKLYAVSGDLFCIARDNSTVAPRLHKAARAALASAIVLGLLWQVHAALLLTVSHPDVLTVATNALSFGIHGAAMTAFAVSLAFLGGASATIWFLRIGAAAPALGAMVDATFVWVLTRALRGGGWQAVALPLVFAARAAAQCAVAISFAILSTFTEGITRFKSDFSGVTSPRTLPLTQAFTRGAVLGVSLAIFVISAAGYSVSGALAGKGSQQHSHFYPFLSSAKYVGFENAFHCVYLVPMFLVHAFWYSSRASTVIATAFLSSVAAIQTIAAVLQTSIWVSLFLVTASVSAVVAAVSLHHNTPSSKRRVKSPPHRREMSPASIDAQRAAPGRFILIDDALEALWA